MAEKLDLEAVGRQRSKDELKELIRSSPTLRSKEPGDVGDGSTALYLSFLRILLLLMMLLLDLTIIELNPCLEKAPVLFLKSHIKIFHTKALELHYNMDHQ